MDKNQALWLLILKADGYDWSLTQFDDNYNFVIMKRNNENTQIVESNDCIINDCLDTAKARFDNWRTKNKQFN